MARKAYGGVWVLRVVFAFFAFLFSQTLSATPSLDFVPPISFYQTAAFSLPSGPKGPPRGPENPEEAAAENLSNASSRQEEKSTVSSDTIEDSPNLGQTKKVKLRASFRGEPLSENGQGGSLDIFFLSRIIRVASRFSYLQTDGLSGKEQLASFSLLTGVAYPKRITPFIEGYLGAGLWHQSLFGQEIFLPSIQTGFDSGAEFFVTKGIFFFSTAGYAQTFRQSRSLDGSKKFETFGGASFRFGFGFGATRKSR